MPSRVSAGLVIHRVHNGQLEVLLEHPGGPLYTHKDQGCWSIPKGEIEPHESMLETAIREAREETGLAIPPESKFTELGSIRQKGGKIVHAWAVPWNGQPCDLNHAASFTLEWPPESGRFESFQEVDRAEFFNLSDARQKIKPTQIPLLNRLAEFLKLPPA